MNESDRAQLRDVRHEVKLLLDRIDDMLGASGVRDTPASSGSSGQGYLTPSQACVLIPGMTKEHLAQLRFIGKGPKFLKPTPRKVLYRESDVLEWLEASERTSTAEGA